MQMYSKDDEIFMHNSLNELYNSLDEEPYVGMTYFVAEVERFTPESTVHIDRILEMMDEDMYEEIGESYDYEFSESSPEAKKELLLLISDWVRKHACIDRYYRFVGKSKEMQVTEGDL